VPANFTLPGSNHPSRDPATPLEMRMDHFKGQFLLRHQANPLRHQHGHCQQQGHRADRPSGCGKSTLLRTFNRMHETVRNAAWKANPARRQEHSRQDVTSLRRRIGMVFSGQSVPNQFLTTWPTASKSTAPSCPCGSRRKSLRHAALWDEVKDHLHNPPTNCPAVSSSACASPAPGRRAGSSLLDEPLRARSISTAKSRSCWSSSRTSAPSPSSHTNAASRSRQ